MPDIHLSDDSGLSRRTVLRGAGAAWAASAITLATAVPAVAASGPAHFGTAVYTHDAVNKKVYNPSVSFTNTGGAGIATLALTRAAALWQLTITAGGWTTATMTTNILTPQALNATISSNAPLASGPHTIVLSVTKPNNNVTTPNTTFTVVVSPA